MPSWATDEQMAAAQKIMPGAEVVRGCEEDNAQGTPDETDG
jgi:hypothetical protein